MEVTDNFLPPELFKELQNYCNDNEFQIVQVGEKEFSVLPVPDYVMPYLEIHGYELILSFLRSAKNDFDTNYRIHADHVLNGRKTALASVLYVNSNKGVSVNGTSFWRHHIHGERLPDDTSNEEFDRLLLEDSDDLSKWEHVLSVFAVPNRMLVFDSNLFHSKFPKVVKTGERKVLVCFYEKIH